MPRAGSSRWRVDARRDEHADAPVTHGEPVSVDFEPAPLRPRRRRIDPVLIGAAIVVVGLLAAIVKPWGDADEPRVATAPTASPSATAQAETLPPSAARVIDALQPHDAWGIQAVTGDSLLEERWVALDEGTDTARSGTIGGRDEPIIALGITTPSASRPLDVRVSRPTAEGDQEWLDVRRVAPLYPGGHPVLWPPGSDGSTPRTWPAGRYRVELLMGASIERIDVAIPGRFERIPADRAGTVRPAGTAETMGIRPVLGPPGLFVIDRGAIERLNVRPVEPFDEAGVWLSSVSEGGNRSETVATIFRPLATGIGVQLPANATSVDAAIRRLSPDTDWPSQDQVTIMDLALADDDHHVVLWAPDGRPWEPGTYAIDLKWDDDGGHQVTTWHIAFLPGGGA